MKIEKALEILTLNYKDQAHGMPKDCAVALFMGMGALEAVKNARANNYYTPIPGLPGEDVITPAHFPKPLERHQTAL